MDERHGAHLGNLFMERGGIDRATAYETLKDSAIASPYVHYKQGAFVDHENEPLASSLRLMQRDVGLATALGRDLAVPMLMAAQADQG